jgi:FMN phosphatase YigB (HAD superfamily)
MAYRAVVFDLFDTLVDLRFEDLERVEHRGKSLPASVTRLHASVAEHHDIDLDSFLAEMRAVDRALRDVQVEEGREISTHTRFERLLERLDLSAPGLVDRLTEVHMGTIQGLVAVPGHHEPLLRELRRHVRVGLCSNFTHAPTALDVVEMAGFGAHFDAVVISETVGWRKPRKEIFHAVLDALDVAPHEVLHVGDSLRADIAGAAPLGIRTAWVTRRVRDPEAQLRDHEGPAPDHQMADLAELLELVETGGT